MSLRGTCALTLCLVATLATPAASATEVSDAPAGASDEASFEDEAPATRTRFAAKVALGPALSGIFDEPIYGFDLQVALGASLPRRGIFVFGTMGYLRGETPAGLNVHRPSLGAMFEWDFGRWHAGLGPQLNALVIPRATSDDVLLGLGLGMEAMVSVDLYEGSWGDGLFLGLLGHTSLEFPAIGPHYGGGLRLGYRL